MTHSPKYLPRPSLQYGRVFSHLTLTSRMSREFVLYISPVTNDVKCNIELFVHQ